MTKILIDSKLIAYNSCLHRNNPIVEALTAMENIVHFLQSSLKLTSYEVVLGFDFGKSRFRAELLESYKGHRVHMVTEKSKEQQEAYNKFQTDYREVLPQLAANLGIRVVGVEGVECDDLISILANTTKHDVIMVTEDRDYLQVQLAHPTRVRQFLPKSFSLLSYEDVVAMEKGVIDKESFLLKKAILGDSADGILGLVQCGSSCFSTWFTPLKGTTRTRAEWKTLFVRLANSKDKFKIHKDYTINSFEALYDLNVALGETMVNTSRLNEQELKDYRKCIHTVPVYNESAFMEMYLKNFSTSKNDFGDFTLPSTYPALRGVIHG